MTQSDGAEVDELIALWRATFGGPPAVVDPPLMRSILVRFVPTVVADPELRSVVTSLCDAEGNEPLLSPFGEVHAAGGVEALAETSRDAEPL